MSKYNCGSSYNSLLNTLGLTLDDFITPCIFECQAQEVEVASVFTTESANRGARK